MPWTEGRFEDVNGTVLQQLNESSSAGEIDSEIEIEINGMDDV